MGAKTMDHGALARAAYRPSDADQTIDVTIASAKIAVLHAAICLMCSRLQLSGAKQLQIARLENWVRTQSLYTAR